MTIHDFARATGAAAEPFARACNCQNAGSDSPAMPADTDNIRRRDRSAENWEADIVKSSGGMLWWELTIPVDSMNSVLILI